MMEQQPRKWIHIFCALTALLCAVGCTTMKDKTTVRTDRRDAVGQFFKEEPGSKESIETSGSEKRSGTMGAAEIEKLTLGEVIRVEEPNTANLYDNSRYDFPITVNSRVEGWIDYFTGRGRPHMERYLGRSSRYIPVMKQILKKMGLPEDLVYLALIESGFNLQARSHARAVGPWQFMKATGKRYGLRVDSWLDERRDPLRSTEAAGRYLKDLYLMFESWYLAASAYNAGEFKILRAIDTLKTNNYWRICDTTVLRRETKDYIPKLIAAAIIAKNPGKFGFGEIAYQDPLEFEIVYVDFPARLSEVADIIDVPTEDLHELNPHLIHAVIPPGEESFALRIPIGTKTLVESSLASMRTRFVSSTLPAQHIVKRGETLHSLSQKYRVRVRDLANANNMSPREKLSPGATLVIPKKGVTTGQVATVNRSVTSSKTASVNGYITHTVRRGESLWSISQKYDVTVQDIFQWNNLKKPKIMPGLKLRIRGGKDGGISARSGNLERPNGEVESDRFLIWT